MDTILSLLLQKYGPSCYLLAAIMLLLFPASAVLLIAIAICRLIAPVFLCLLADFDQQVFLSSIRLQ